MGGTIDCNLVVGLTQGVSPNVEFLKGSEIELAKGVKVNRFLESNVPVIFAIDDCAEQREAISKRRPIEAVWYTGRMMGETDTQTICGNRTEYKSGYWFNSAKFLDIECQAYDCVFNTMGRKNYEEHFHWRHSAEKICITVSFHKDSGKFLKINNLGIRMRHEVFNRWLTEERGVDFVMENLVKANFDPEFYHKYEKDILNYYKLTPI